MELDCMLTLLKVLKVGASRHEEPYTPSSFSSEMVECTGHAPADIGTQTSVVMGAAINLTAWIYVAVVRRDRTT
jgi:hypothetical protein